MLFYQPINGYCYNSDTHFLYNFICENLKKFKNIRGNLLDIGSGSGILGLLLARDYDKLVLNQSEIQKEFQFFSQKNAQCANIISLMHKGSFLEFEFDKKFDICVSNPPFYHKHSLKSENKNIKVARYNDNFSLKDFIFKVSKIIKSDGKFFFCYDAKQLHEIINLLNEFKLNIEAMQFVHSKKNKESHLVMIYARMNSKSLVRIMPPLVVFNEDSEITKDVDNIYKKTLTYSIKASIE